MRKAQQREERKGKNEFAAWLKVCKHFFPSLHIWLNNMVDPGNQLYITYSQAVLVLMCIMKNVTGIGTMRSMNAVFNETSAIENLSILSEDPSLTEMPDWQTANNYLERLDTRQIENVRRLMIYGLLRSKQFDRYKFKGNWKIIIDGTGYAYFKERHCKHDLVSKIKNPETGKETIMYFHKVLEAKIVFAPNLLVSIDTEFRSKCDESSLFDYSDFRSDYAVIHCIRKATEWSKALDQK